MALKLAAALQLVLLTSYVAGELHYVKWGSILNPKQSVRLHRNDQVVFYWTSGLFNVVEQPGPKSFENCVFLRGKTKVLYPRNALPVRRGFYKTVPLPSGTHYYTSSAGQARQCKAGLKYKVYVP